LARVAAASYTRPKRAIPPHCTISSAHEHLHFRCTIWVQIRGLGMLTGIPSDVDCQEPRHVQLHQNEPDLVSPHARTHSNRCGTSRLADGTDRGAMRTPSLRNVAERAPYMHNGGLASLEAVVDFYIRGGDFNAPNKDPRVRPRNINPQQRAALLAFLRRSLSDPRVTAGIAPFDQPQLYTQSSRVPILVGQGRAGSAGNIPQISAIEPPLLGSTNFTVAVSQALGGASATLVVGLTDPGLVASVPVGDFAQIPMTLAGIGAGLAAS